MTLVPVIQPVLAKKTLKPQAFCIKSGSILAALRGAACQPNQAAFCLICQGPSSICLMICEHNAAEFCTCSSISAGIGNKG